jgi:hypothetical protein
MAVVRRAARNARRQCLRRLGGSSLRLGFAVGGCGRKEKRKEKREERREAGVCGRWCPMVGFLSESPAIGPFWQGSYGSGRVVGVPPESGPSG